MGEVEINGTVRTYKKGFTHSEYTPWLKNFIKEDRLMANDLSVYLNSPALREALHIPSYVPSWSACWNDDHYYEISP